jgi:3-mercaptopyruvate sulfurtransferase SseA
LRGRGFTNVRALRGGISGWRDRGYPLHPARHHSRAEPTLGVEVQSQQA